MWAAIAENSSTAVVLLLAGAAVGACYKLFWFPLRHLQTAEQRRGVLPPGASR
eukprot:COSAG02_NODE_30986_length_541_cov_1.144796_1_plen_52_part_10